MKCIQETHLPKFAATAVSLAAVIVDAGCKFIEVRAMHPFAMALHHLKQLPWRLDHRSICPCITLS
jgi:hypothetical protein